MISGFAEAEEGEKHGAEQAHGGADDSCAETGGSGAQGGGCSAGERGIEAHDLCLESEVRGDGCERSAGSQAVARREHAAAEAGGGPLTGQGSLAVGDPKKRM